MHLFTEKLSLRAYLSVYLFVRGKNYDRKDVHLRYIYKDRFTAWIEQIFPNFNLGSVKEFDFNFDSLVDENGLNLGKNVVFEDLEEVYRMIEKKICLTNQLQFKHDVIWFKAFLKKKITVLEPFSNSGVNKLRGILIMIQAVAFYKKKICI